MSSVWKDLHLNPRVESCFTCLRRVSSFLCTFQVLGYQPPDDVASLLFCFALDCHLELTFQNDNLSAEGSASSCSKGFLTGVGFDPTHTVVYQNSRLRDFLSLAPQTARSSCLIYVEIFPFDVCPFNWVTFLIEWRNVLNGLCHLFGKICT